MLPFPMPTGLSNLMQVAWVTPDLDRTMAEFGDRFGIPDFFVADVSYQARLFEETGEMKMRLALANLDNMQIELIQPVGGGVDRIYREVLPVDGSHATVFHHICVRIDGPSENWEAYVNDLTMTTPIGYTGDYGPEVRFVYTDERRTLGIWLEHVWYEPEYFKQLTAMIPAYNSN